MTYSGGSSRRRMDEGPFVMDWLCDFTAQLPIIESIWVLTYDALLVIYLLLMITGNS